MRLKVVGVISLAAVSGWQEERMEFKDHPPSYQGGHQRVSEGEYYDEHDVLVERPYVKVDDSWHAELQNILHGLGDAFNIYQEDQRPSHYRPKAPVSHPQEGPHPHRPHDHAHGHPHDRSHERHGHVDDERPQDHAHAHPGHGHDHVHRYPDFLSETDEETHHRRAHLRGEEDQHLNAHIQRARHDPSNAVRRHAQSHVGPTHLLDDIEEQTFVALDVKSEAETDPWCQDQMGVSILLVATGGSSQPNWRVWHEWHDNAVKWMKSQKCLRDFSPRTILNGIYHSQGNPSETIPADLPQWVDLPESSHHCAPGHLDVCKEETLRAGMAPSRRTESAEKRWVVLIPADSIPLKRFEAVYRELYAEGVMLRVATARDISIPASLEGPHGYCMKDTIHADSLWMIVRGDVADSLLKEAKRLEDVDGIRSGLCLAAARTVVSLKKNHYSSASGQVVSRNSDEVQELLETSLSHPWWFSCWRSCEKLGEMRATYGGRSIAMEKQRNEVELHAAHMSEAGEPPYPVHVRFGSLEEINAMSAATFRAFWDDKFQDIVKTSKAMFAWHVAPDAVIKPMPTLRNFYSIFSSDVHIAKWLRKHSYK